MITRKPVLIPRPETEEWVSDIIKKLNNTLDHNRQTRYLRILDLCTGSGCIAVSVAYHLKKHLAENNLCYDIKVVGVDNQQHCVRMASLSARKFKVDDIVAVKYCDLFNDDLVREIGKFGPYDIILTNPPYISDHEVQLLEPDVTQHEDRAALSGTKENHDGLLYYKRILEVLDLLGYKKVGPKSCETKVERSQFEFNTEETLEIPSITMEIGGEHQIPGLLEIFKSKFNHIRIYNDMFGKTRVLQLQ
jgi:release factor glutamine methyltransferase